MTAQELYDKIEAIIDKEVKALDGKIPAAEKQLFNKIIARSKSLETNTDGDLKQSIFNVKEIQNITGSINTLVDSSKWVDMSSNFASTLYEISDLQNKYFASLKQKMPPKEFRDALQKKIQADVIEELSGDKLKASIKGTLNTILTTATTSGGSFADMVDTVKKSIVTDGNNPGALKSHAKTVVVDTIANNSRAYENAIAGHIGLEWGMYVGGNIKSTRPTCLACTKRRYWHKSEIPLILNGSYPEFALFNGKINEDTGLPYGMPDYENASNFTTLLGGYGCRHRWIWVSAEIVPIGYKGA